MPYNFYFNSEQDAFDFVDRAIYIAKNYDIVLLSDLYDIKGQASSYKDNHIGWTLSNINVHVHVLFDTDSKSFVVSFPEPDFHKDGHDNKKESAICQEPLNVTICIGELDDSLEVVHEVLNSVEQIKDRPVFITIT